jgi:prevent-host-death family protein
MKTINIHAAKTQFSSLVAEVEAGEEIIIAKAGKPVARLIPLQKNDFRRSFGALKGRIHMKDNFDDPLPPEIAKAFGIGS